MTYLGWDMLDDNDATALAYSTHDLTLLVLTWTTCTTASHLELLSIEFIHLVRASMVSSPIWLSISTSFFDSVLCSFYHDKGDHIMLTALEKPPSPLEPPLTARCPNCSLFSLCLPDEVKLLRARKEKALANTLPD